MRTIPFLIMSTSIFRSIFNQGTRLVFMYVRLYVWNYWRVNSFSKHHVCQQHARKAEKTSNFHIEAKPYPDPVHPKSTCHAEALWEGYTRSRCPPCCGRPGYGRNSGIFEFQFSTSFHKKTIRTNKFSKVAKSIHRNHLHF